MLIFHLYFIHLLSCIHQHHFMVTISSYWHRLDAAGITDRPHRGFQDVSWNKNTPTKSSIYRWIFHDKPSIFGISPDIPPHVYGKPLITPLMIHGMITGHSHRKFFRNPPFLGYPKKITSKTWITRDDPGDFNDYRNVSHGDLGSPMTLNQVLLNQVSRGFGLHSHAKLVHVAWHQPHT